LVERAVQARPAVAGGAEGHLLSRIVGIGYPVVVGADHGVGVDEVFGQGRLSCALVHTRHRATTPGRGRSEQPVRIHFPRSNQVLEAVANCAAWVLGVWLVGWEDGVWRSRTVRWIVIRRYCCLLICGSGCRLSTWCG